MNLSEVKASYTAGKRADALKDPWAHYVARPLSFYPAWLCIKLGISANIVTIIGLSLGLAGCIGFAYGHMIWGAILVNVYGLLDYVDGDIARATKMQSDYGARLDGFSYMAIVAVLFVCVGIGLNNPQVLVFGVVASFIRTFRYAITYQAQVQSQGGKPNIFIRLGMATIGAREPLLLVCAISGHLDYFLYFYCAVNFCELLVVIPKVLRK